MCPFTEVFLIALDFFFWLVIASAILSWLFAFNVVNPQNQFIAMIGDFLYRVTEPALRPIRRHMPDLGGIDLSPIVLFLLIILIKKLVVTYLIIPGYCI